MTDCVAFDLGGVLVKPERSRDPLQLVPDSDKIIGTAAQYENLLIQSAIPNYEPGDIPIRLMTILLLAHGVTEADMVRSAGERTMMPGALDLVSRLLTDGWRVFCITNAYEPFAVHITHKFGIYAHNIASTPLPLESLRAMLTEKDLAVYNSFKEQALALNSTDDAAIKQAFDKFFNTDLPSTGAGKSILETIPVSGVRRTAALKLFVEKYQEPLRKWVVVGDSRADVDMFAEVDKQGGLAIAFNGNRYTLSTATMSLASTSIDDLREIFQAWRRGGRKEVRRVIQEKEKRSVPGGSPRFHWLAERDKAQDINEIIRLHNRIRQATIDSVG